MMLETIIYSYNKLQWCFQLKMLKWKCTSSDKEIFNKAGSVSKKEGQHDLAVSIKQLSCLSIQWTIWNIILYYITAWSSDQVGGFYCIVTCSLFIFRYSNTDILDKTNRDGKAKQINKQTNEQTRKDHFPMDIPGYNRRCIILEITTSHMLTSFCNGCSGDTARHIMVQFYNCC